MKQPSLSAAGLAVVAAFAFAACSKAPDVPAPAAPPVAPTPVAAKSEPKAASDLAEAGIAWKEASSDADVDAAFASARAETKPVFVYWGAKWCPPCNQVKATLFNRQDFIERSRAFVAVSVDGDSPGAQKLGTRFRVSGYPTMVLFKPSGEEVTRLPGEVDPARYGELLNLGMNATRPVKAVLADALAGGKDLKANDWRLLAFYSWETDQTQVVAKDQVAATLAKLSAACPADQPETAMRLRLKALAARDAKTPAPADLAARPAVLAALADPAASRDVADQLVNSAPDIARALAAPATPERTQVLAALDTALQRLEADKTLSRADRMQALIARVDLVRIDLPEDPPAASGKPAPLPHMPEALLAHVRDEAARADREITDGYERQAVITSAAHLLGQAGLLSEADKLLETNLAKSHSPYYLMLGLASNAKKRGDKAGALRWYREAYEKSEGPATRMQWGAGYLSALVDLAPADEAAIESTTLQFWREAAPLPDAFEQRSGRAMQKVGNKLQAWNKGGAHGAAMARLRSELDTVCTTQVKAEAGRATCKALLTPAPKASA